MQLSLLTKLIWVIDGWSTVFEITCLLKLKVVQKRRKKTKIGMELVKINEKAKGWLLMDLPNLHTERGKHDPFRPRYAHM